MRRQLFGERFRERDQSTLRRRVRTSAGTAAIPPRDRNDIDDRASLPRDHSRDRRAGDERHALEIEIHDVVPDLFRELRDRLPLHQRPRVVHENVDRTEPFRDRLHQRRRRVHPPDVGPRPSSPCPLPPQSTRRPPPRRAHCGSTRSRPSRPNRPAPSPWPRPMPEEAPVTSATLPVISR